MLGSGGSRAETLQQARSADIAESVHESLVFPHFAKNLFAVVEQVRQGGMNLAEGEVRQSFGDLLGHATVNFGLRVNVLHPDASPGNQGSGLTAPIGTKFDVGRGVSHVLIYIAFRREAPNRNKKPGSDGATGRDVGV